MIGYGVGYRLNGYGPLPLETYWLAMWLLIAAGFVFGRPGLTASLSAAGFVAGLIATPWLAADPYAMWGVRALLVGLTLLSLVLALAVLMTSRKRSAPAPT